MRRMKRMSFWVVLTVFQGSCSLLEASARCRELLLAVASFCCISQASASLLGAFALFVSFSCIRELLLAVASFCSLSRACAVFVSVCCIC